MFGVNDGQCNFIALAGLKDESTLSVRKEIQSEMFLGGKRSKRREGPKVIVAKTNVGKDLGSFVKINSLLLLHILN